MKLISQPITLVSLILLLSLNTTSAQKKKSFFIDKNNQRVSEKIAKYKRVTQKTDTGIIVKDYFLNGSIQMEGIYNDKNLKHRIDTFKYYHINGNISKIMFYKNNLTEGESRSYFVSGKLSRISNFKNGNPIGRWTWFNEEGHEINVIDEANSSKIRQYNSKAYYIGGNKALSMYFKKIKYPEEALNMNVIGRVFIAFKISETGIVDDVDFIVHGTHAMDSVIKKQILEMPKWNAALENGKPVAEWKTMPFNFRLNQGKQGKLSEKELAHAFYKSGVKNFKNHEFEKAIFKFSQAIYYNNTKANYYFNLGLSYYKLNNVEKACENWNIVNMIDNSFITPTVKEVCGF